MTSVIGGKKLAANTINSKSTYGITYTLHVDGEPAGAIADLATADKPLYAVYGRTMLPALEVALEGMSVGDSFSITLNPDETFGEYDPELVFEMDKPANVTLTVGQSVQIEGEEAYVREVDPKFVLVDFNHPLAGLKLTFEVEVIDIHATTPNEARAGLAYATDADADAAE